MYWYRRGRVSKKGPSLLLQLVVGRFSNMVMMQITPGSNAFLHLFREKNQQTTEKLLFCVYVPACFPELLRTNRERERAFRWPSLKRSPPVSDVIYYLKRSGMLRKTERRLKNDKMKVFIRTAFLCLFCRRRGISPSRDGNEVWKQNWWVCVMWFSFRNIILQCLSAFGRIYLDLHIYISEMTGT